MVVVRDEIVVGVFVIWHQVASKMIVTFQLDLVRVDCILRHQEILSIDSDSNFVLVVLRGGQLSLVLAQLQLLARLLVRGRRTAHMGVKTGIGVQVVAVRHIALIVGVLQLLVTTMRVQIEVVT